MSAARRGEGGGGRERGRAGSTTKKAGAARGKRAAGREEPTPRGRSRARSSRETRGRAARAPARPERGAEEPAAPKPVEREPALLPEADLLREVLGDLLAPWQAPPRFTPPVDVRETDDVYEVVCELPGVASDDVHVSAHGDRLRIEGEKRWRTVRDDEFVHAIERGQGRFVRAFRLPFAADPDRIQASFEDGLLRVRVPKPRGAASRTIQVRARVQTPRPLEGPGPAAAREPSAGQAEQAEQAEVRAEEHETDASGGVHSARPPHRPRDEGPLPVELREEAFAPETTSDLEIPHVGGRQAQIGGQGAGQTSAGGIPQPGGEAKGPTHMGETPLSDYEASPAFLRGHPVEGEQGGGGHTP